MTVLAIDPGTTHSGVAFNAHGRWHFEAKRSNEDLIVDLTFGSLGAAGVHIRGAVLLIEEFKNYGMAVGDSSIKTVLWSGRFWEAWESRGGVVVFVPRATVKAHHCGTVKAKDANVRAAMLDKFPAGTKKQPGPLHGCTSHAMQAAALAAYWIEAQP